MGDSSDCPKLYLHSYLPSLECADASALSKAASRCRTPKLEVIVNLHQVAFEVVNSFDKCRRSNPLEPRGRTPSIRRRLRDDPMMNRVAVHIVQASKVG